MSAFEEAQHPRDPAGRFTRVPFDRSQVRLPAYSDLMPGDFTAFELADDPYNMSDAEYNAGGTYDYPPVPRSAAQVRAFWASTQIPDIAVAHYERMYAGDVDASVQAHLQRWGSTHPEPPARDTAEHAAWEDDRADADTEFRAERDREIHRPYLRMAVRVMKIVEDGRYLEQDERDKLKHSRIVYAPDKEPATVQRIDQWLGIRSNSIRDLALLTTPELEKQGQLSYDDMEQIMRRAVGPLAQQIERVQQAAQGATDTVMAGYEWEDRRAGRIR